MYVMVYDTETSGLDTQKDFIMELGWAQYWVDEITNSWRLVNCTSKLLAWSNLDYQVAREAQEATGLSRPYCEKHGEYDADVFEEFQIAALTSQALAGQNIILYDKAIVKSNLQRIKAFTGHLDTLHIDTLFDIPEGKIKPKALKYFALDHGYVLNGAHQAMNDVFACAHILSQYPIQKILEIAQTPLVKISCQIGYSEIKTRELLYKRGFRWDKDLKVYQKTVREFYLKELIDGLSGSWKVENLDTSEKVMEAQCEFGF